MIERRKNPAGILLTIILISALLTVCLELGLNYLRPGTSGSIPRHLIHFVIMFALLGSATLLCLFCPPFKKLWAWLDQQVMTAETRPISIDIIYAVLAGLMILHHFYVILYYPAVPSGATRFAPFWIVLAALTVILGKSWRETSFRIAAAFLILNFERLYIEKLSITGETAVYFFSAVYALFICLGVFSALRPSVRKPFLQVLCALWAFASLALSIAGMYTAWTGTQISNLVGTTTHVEEGRLWIFAYPTITAAFTSCGSIMALIGLSVSKRKSVKVLYLIICFIIMIANALPYARASIITLAFMAAGTLCIGLWSIYRNQRFGKITEKRTTLVIIALIFCFGACFYGAVEGQRALGTQFIEVRNSGNLIVPGAKAEAVLPDTSTEPDTAQNPPEFEQRDIWFSENTDPNLILSNRLLLWQRARDCLYANPGVLLYGLSVDGNAVVEVVHEPHSHNLLIQILLEGGLPALLLFLSLVFYGILHAFRLLNRTGIPFWQRLLPLPMLSILLWEMVECVSHFSYGHPPMTLFWFFLGATIAVSKSLGKASESTMVHPTSTVAKAGE